MPQGLNHVKRRLPPALLLCRDYEQVYPTPNREAFIKPYRKAGGQIEVAVFIGEGNGFLTKNISRPKAQAASEQLLAFVQKRQG